MLKKSLLIDLEFHGQVKCPYCDGVKKKKVIIRSWEYGSNKVSRLQCRCGKEFNFYKSKNSSWTIPKNSETMLGRKKRYVK